MTSIQLLQKEGTFSPTFMSLFQKELFLRIIFAFVEGRNLLFLS